MPLVRQRIILPLIRLIPSDSTFIEREALFLYTDSRVILCSQMGRMNNRRRKLDGSLFPTGQYFPMVAIIRIVSSRHNRDSCRAVVCNIRWHPRITFERSTSAGILRKMYSRCARQFHTSPIVRKDILRAFSCGFNPLFSVRIARLQIRNS